MHTNSSVLHCCHMTLAYMFALADRVQLSPFWGKKHFEIKFLNIKASFLKASALHCEIEGLVQYAMLYTAHLGKCAGSSGYFMHGDNTAYILQTTYFRNMYTLHTMSSTVVYMSSPSCPLAHLCPATHTYTQSSHTKAVQQGWKFILTLKPFMNAMRGRGHFCINPAWQRLTCLFVVNICW